MSSHARNNIQNIEGYNINFQDNYSTIFSKYMLIISEYLKHALDNIYLQNISYRKYIIKNPTRYNLFNFSFPQKFVRDGVGLRR